jgi:hypothetical protein
MAEEMLYISELQDELFESGLHLYVTILKSAEREHE